MPASRIYNPFVGAGGGGGTPDPNSEEIHTMPFSYTDTTKLVLNIPAGARILQTNVSITTPFNDNASTVMVGDSGLNNRLMQSSQNDPTTADSYQSHTEYQYGATTSINVYINAGSSTQGAGLVSVIYNLNN